MLPNALGSQVSRIYWASTRLRGPVILQVQDPGYRKATPTSASPSSTVLWYGDHCDMTRPARGLQVSAYYLSRPSMPRRWTDSQVAGCHSPAFAHIPKPLVFSLDLDEISQRGDFYISIRAGRSVSIDPLMS